MSAPILVAYDPFRDDPAPVELALAAASLSDAPVTAVAVNTSPAVVGDLEDDRGAERALTAESALARLGAQLGVDTRLEHDHSVPRALHRVAEEVGAGLIVVGSSDRGPVGRVLPGSTAERMLHGSPCPVALAPHGYERTPLQTIAVGFVDTPEGHAALHAAHLLAARVGARVRAISVLRRPLGPDTTPPGESSPHLSGSHRDEAEQVLAAALAALPAGVEVQPEFHVDDAAELLLRVSENVDALVCGSRGYGPLRSVLLGGVSRRLVDAARCPVLVVPRGVERPLEDLLPATAETRSP